MGTDPVALECAMGTDPVALEGRTPIALQPPILRYSR